ncbi:pentatricopeptide repeat (PPR) superfamily protein [Tasmannia lanceolata]|uniref:pentatricopeptide repeat (PPR) superfamily protein n=1 Tax=Tasmannia lanceolata TaxID=3420 RepID=UPI0040639920
MRYLSKFRFLDSIPCKNYLSFQAFKFQLLSHSIHYKSSHTKPSKKAPLCEETQLKNPHTKAKDIGSLFHQITEIVGTHNISIEKNQLKIPISEEIDFKNPSIKQQHESTPPVCENADENVSLVVHKITEIIRAENPEIPMEEYPESEGFVFDPLIVEKVLKRCFKVRHLALRFFNWVKLRPGFRHTTETYNTMIYIAGEAKEFDLVKKLVEEMDVESCPKDIKTWTILISHYGKSKLIGEALVVFDKMRQSGFEPDEAAYKSMVHALCNVGKSELAMEFYKEMVSKNFGIDMKLYKMLMSCLLRSGDVESVRMVGDDMMRIVGIPEHEVYSFMLESFCVSGKIEEALGLVHEIRKKNITSDPKNFEIFVKGLCRAGRVMDAVEIVDIMKQNHAVDGKVYEIIINGYLRIENSSKAFELFSSMKESGYLPTARSYTEMIQHFFKSNEYEKACKLYEEMLKSGIQPDTLAIMAMVAGHVRQNYIPEAWRAFESMKKMGIVPTRKAYMVFIKELCKVSKPHEALKLLKEMLDSKINVGDEIFRLIISSLEKKGELEKVVEITNLYRACKLYDQEAKLVDIPKNHQSLSDRSSPLVNIHKIPSYLFSQDINSNKTQPLKTDVHLVEPLTKGYNDHDLQEVCRILCSVQDWCLIQKRLEKITVQLKPELVVEILHNCQRDGNTALRFFSWVGQQPGYSHTTETYNMAIKISGSAKDFKHMRNLYQEMRRKQCPLTANTWTIMITQYGRAGLTEIASKKFEEMKIDECKPNQSTYKYLIIFLCERKGRKVGEAIKIFEEMIHAGYTPDRELVEIYLACLCESGKLSDARNCVKYLSKSCFTIQSSYSLLVKALCRAGKLDEALALEDEMGALGCSVDQYIYGSLIHGLLRGGRFNEALRKVDAMKQGDTSLTVHVYTSLIVHFSKEKQIGKVLEILKKMREDGCEPTVVTYSALIHGFMNVGMFFDARNVFRRMKLKGPFPDFRTYSMFVTCLCKSGRSEEALRLIHEMMGSGILPSTINFQTVFYGLNREGKKELARTVLQTKWALARKRKFSV